MFKTFGNCIHYPRSAKGRHSVIAKLCKATDLAGFHVKADEANSELRLGDYPEGPSRLEHGQVLADGLK